MVSAANFFATVEDEAMLLDYLGEPRAVTLHPWPVCDPSVHALDRSAAAKLTRVMIANVELGPPKIMDKSDPAVDGATRAALFNRMNWERLAPLADQGLVDSNSSPVLLWQRGICDGSVLRQSAIGSQADSPRGDLKRLRKVGHASAFLGAPPRYAGVGRGSARCAARLGH